MGVNEWTCLGGRKEGGCGRDGKAEWRLQTNRTGAFSELREGENGCYNYCVWYINDK